MAMHPLRLRRTLTTLITLNRTALSSVSNPTIPPAITGVSSSARTATRSPVNIFQSRWFRSSLGPLSSQRQYKLYKEGDEITEDTILFEGCDYNHWLITVDFPKDNKPPPEEMVRTYERICAQGLGISVEEAKKRIYACSTTTYEGFQAIMTEQESEKFNDVPGVVFVLPDSYIDPVNKEYGGDKYDNGVITPRPPPIQYGRNPGGRFRPRNPGQSRYDPQRNQRGFDQVDGRNYSPPQNYPPQQNVQQSPMNNREYAPRGPDPSYQGSNYGPRQGGNYGQRANPGANSGAYPASGYGQSYEQGSNTASGQSSNPGYGQGYGQGSNYPGQNSNSGYGQSYGQGSNYHASGQNSNSGYGQSYKQGSNYPVSGQNSNSGYGQSYEQGSNYPASGQNYGYGPGATPTSGQGANAGYEQTYPGHGADQRFSQAGQPAQPARPMGRGGMQQERY